MSGDWAYNIWYIVSIQDLFYFIIIKHYFYLTVL
jgi:hypothetical protein